MTPTSQITSLKTEFDGDGIFIVGTDISPGTYVTDGSDGCYWARLRNLGGELAGVLATDNVTGHTIVAIKSSDKGFQTSGCAPWKKR